MEERASRAFLPVSPRRSACVTLKLLLLCTARIQYPAPAQKLRRLGPTDIRAHQMRLPGYEIQRTIGKGGMATVYLAVQESLDRLVALKVLPSKSAIDDPEATHGDVNALALTDRFLNEGRIVSSIGGANVIRVFDVGATSEYMYISMEYVPGGDLRSRLGEPFAPRSALEILMKLGLALEAAHRKGVIHRDVKPANILFRDDGTPLLTDFGIAKEIHRDLNLTTTGHVLGSPFYISPEQAESLEVDSRTDLYSLGVIFYEMLTGARPFEGTSAIQVILQHLQAPVPRLPGLLSRLQPLLDRLMAKDVESRFSTAAEMVVYADELAQSMFTAPVDGAEEAVPACLPTSPRVPAAVVDGFRGGILEDLAHDRLVLPSLPDVVLNVRRELERRDATAGSIANVISTDPALSAQLLRVANSAFYFGKAPVKDLSGAVIRLGSTVVSQVVMMLVVAQLYDVETKPRVRTHLTRLWQHSTLVASLSELIAARHPEINREEAMLAGLIHDIGALPILVWAEPIPSVIESEDSLSGIIAALHGELGQAILEKWRYPAELVAVPLAHEALSRDAPVADFSDVVQIANLLSYQGTEDARANVAWWELPAALRLNLERDTGSVLLERAREDAPALANALERR